MAKNGIRYPLVLLATIVLMLSCERAPMPQTPIDQSALDHGAQATRSISSTIPAINPSAGGDVLSFRLEDTHLRVSNGPGNIAWSHRGDWLAYTSAFGLWLVPVGRWKDASKVFEASIENGPWDLDSLFLAWSPDDSDIGVTLRSYGTDSNDERYSIGHMAKVDWRKGTFSLIAPNDNVSLTDWSADDRILAYRPDLPKGSEEVLDLSTGSWNPILHPVTGKLGVGAPHWAPDGTLLLGYSTDSKSDTATVYKVDLKTNQWESLGVEMDTYYGTGMPIPSGDGRWIAWVEGDRTASGVVSRIMLYDRKSGRIIKAADSGENGTRGGWEALAWSPDARQLAFSAGYDSDSQTIWILTVSTPDQ